MDQNILQERMARVAREMGLDTRQLEVLTQNVRIETFYRGNMER